MNPFLRTSPRYGDAAVDPHVVSSILINRHIDIDIDIVIDIDIDIQTLPIHTHVHTHICLPPGLPRFAAMRLTNTCMIKPRWIIEPC